MAFRVGLALYGSFVHAWVLDLPGCLVGGRDHEEIAARLPLVVAEHGAWLRSHGEAGVEPGPWRVTETVDARLHEATGGEFCFAADRTPLSRADLEGASARMEHARADLLDEVGRLPDAVLDWCPPETTVAAFDTWAPEVRTMREIVTHVLQLEAYYRDGLRDGPAAGIFESVADPATERALTIARLRALSDAERRRVFRPLRPSRHMAEEWTAAKVLRRIIAHERAHTAEVVQRRTWLLLDMPRPPAG
jgi:hypothetical protein